MPVEEAFSLLAQQEPRLLEVADEVVRVQSRLGIRVMGMRKSGELSTRLWAVQ